MKGTRSGINGPLSNIVTVNFGVVSDGAGLQAFVTDEGASPEMLAA